MSKRLQVLLSNEEMESIQQHAALDNLSVGEYVRRTLKESDSLRPSLSASAKLTLIRQAAGHSFPTADIDQMNREIQQGYLD